MWRLTSLVAAGALAGGVVATSAALVATDPGAPPAAAGALQRFDSCAALRQWYVDHTVDRVTAWGWNGTPLAHPLAVPAQATPLAATTTGSTGSTGSTAAPDTAVASSPTGTNVQEAGVDEPDVAKTDGRLVVRVDRGRLVTTDVSGSTPRQLSSFRLPDGAGTDLLLVDGHALVSGGGPVMVPLTGTPMPRTMPVPTTGSTRVVDVDLTDPARPRLVSDRAFSGQLVTMRQYGDTVRIVTDTGLPDLHFTTPRDSSARAQNRSLVHNRQVVRRSTIGDWLPSVTEHGNKRPLVDCADVLHPQGFAGTGTLTVTGWDVTDPGTTSSVAVTAGGDLVYSSTDRLYVATSQYRKAIPRPIGHDVPMGIMQPVRLTTEVHEFRLAGIGASYTASGSVDGSVRDRRSLDEHDGDLRVAITRQTRDGRSDNGIVVLRDRGGRLVQVGAVHGLGRNEQIQSVRWFDDLAVLVTYRQLDPLFTVDLSDPARPRAVGELEIPGFSGYLHPIGDHLLLGRGVDATRRGQPLGAQAAVFDIGDLAHPRQVDKVTFGAGSSLLAVADPHAFTWLPGERTAFTALTGLAAPFPWERAVSLHVSADGHLTVANRGAAGTTTFRALPLPDGRAALVGDHVRVVGVVR